MEPTDSELILASLRDNPAAFDRLIVRHYERCLRFAYRQLGNRADAEEVVQDAALRAYRALSRCRDRARFGSWLLSIVINQCRSHSARQRRRGVLLHGWWQREPQADRIAPASDLEAEELLRMLPDSMREAFLLKHVEDLTYEEIAAMTGVGVSALKMRVKRATELLAAHLKEIDE